MSKILINEEMEFIKVYNLQNKCLYSFHLPKVCKYLFTQITFRRHLAIANDLIVAIKSYLK